jgi:ABC-type transport system involved in multi-copper enzyme maturation permease subunit
VSETLEAGTPAPPADRLPGPGTWRVSWSGVRTVAGLELRQRVRSTRWILVLVIWGLVLGALTAMIEFGVSSLDQPETGALGFSIIVLLVLSLGSLVAPALSATSVNGDRSAGVLATVQTTLLTPAELALGKLAASWLTSLALLAVALPFIGWSFAGGGTPVGRLLTTLSLLAVMLLVVCAVGLGWSAVTARTTSSAVLTYLTVAMVGVGLPILFFLLIPMNTAQETVTVREPASVADGSFSPDTPAGPCVESKQRQSVVHTERVWWVLAASPYVVLADASPKPADLQNQDALSGIRAGVREARLGEAPIRDYCYDSALSEQERAARDAQRESLAATWPYGLGLNLALGAGFTVLTVRRLRTPTRSLPRGVRVA